MKKYEELGTIYGEVPFKLNAMMVSHAVYLQSKMAEVFRLSPNLTTGCSCQCFPTCSTRTQNTRVKCMYINDFILYNKYTSYIPLFLEARYSRYGTLQSRNDFYVLDHKQWPNLWLGVWCQARFQRQWCTLF